MDLGELQLNQLPKLARYIIPEDKNSDSVLEINLHTMCNGQIDLGIILSRYDGLSDKEDAERVVNAMKCMAMVYEELNGIKYEILKMLYSK